MSKRLLASLVVPFTVSLFWVTSSGSDEDALEKQHFLDALFLNAVHSREACDLDFRPCRVRLQKRTENYYLVVRGENSFLSKEVADVAQNSLLRVISDVERTTGLTPIQGTPKQALNFILLVFVNEKEYASDPENYILARIAPSTLNLAEQRRETFQWFRSSHIECMFLSPPYPDGIIRDVQIWIKVDVSTENMSKCIAEEFFNSFGLDDTDEIESIFDWPIEESQNAERNPMFLTDLHLAFLKKLYDPGMVPNQTEDVTRALIADR